MKAVVQRVTHASVRVDGSEPRTIGVGLVVLIGIGVDDTAKDAEYIANKIAGLRIFEDDAGKMNRDVCTVPGASCLVVSQFTLYGDCRKGRRPSFSGAATQPLAQELYDKVVDLLRNRHGLVTITGEFGADMLVEIHNDGPVTLLLDTPS